MDKGKGVRKYGRLVRSWHQFRYGVHLLVLLPVSYMLLCLIAVLGLLGLGCAIPGLVNAYIASFGTSGGPFVFYLLLLFLSIGSIYGVISFVKSNQKPGSLLAPLPPEENPLLPDEELLVRASSSSAAQPAELLRAAKEPAEEKPEELLRAGTEREA